MGDAMESEAAVTGASSASDGRDTPTSASRPASRTRVPGLATVLDRVGELADPERADLLTTFTEIFLEKAPAEFFEERTPDLVARLSIGAFEFVESSDPEEVDVQVFNADVDREGWYAPVTVIRTHVSERPFIVDTLREFLHSRDLDLEYLIYPILPVVRDDDGRIVGLDHSAEGMAPFSLVHCEVPRIREDAVLQEIRGEVRERLRDVVRATGDFDAMIDAANEVVAELAERISQLPDRKDEFEEIQAFLRWLRDGGFVFLGYRGYDLIPVEAGGGGSGEESGVEDDGGGGEGAEGRALVVTPGSGLGILGDESRSQYTEPVPLDEMDSDLRKLVVGGPTLIITKTNALSTVHRMARMDYIGIKKLDRSGRVVGEHRFVGLFTSRAFGEEAQRIPILRDKLDQILERADVVEGTHDYKEIITIFNSLPKEELFLASSKEIGEDIRTVLVSYHTHEVRVSLREDPLKRGISIMVILPKEQFSGSVRKKIERALVERYEGEVLNYHLTLGGGDQARLHFYLTSDRERLEAVTSDELVQVVRELLRTWEDRVREGLERVRPVDEARKLAREFGTAFSPEYRASMDPSVAVQDILELAAMEADGRTVSVSLSNPEASIAVAGGEAITELRLYLREERLVLSDFMPILENAGLRVIAVTPFEIGPHGDPEIRGDGAGAAAGSEREGAHIARRGVIFTFAVQGSDGTPLDVKVRGAILSEAILAVRAGDATNDSLNALVVSAGLAWREVDVLRAYASYAFQLGAVPSRQSLPSALKKYPSTARILFDLFQRRFDPERAESLEARRAELDDVSERFFESLDHVDLLSDDRALRRLFTLIQGTVRTNYYLHGGKTPVRRSGGVPYISLKFSTRELESVVRSRLLYEVWVRSSRMEGVHLRGGRVARGGIRWSDRPDDFRTEVLGLVQTQMTKNAVIVPAGSKGGFVTTRVFPDRAEMLEEGKEQYRTLMRGLLDLTDNLDDEGRPVLPPEVVRHDEPDPYLVVAADKGTAAFSDVANGVAAEYGFWLDDAFASGGSHGYDHKAVGITARGAWWCVRRHFLERGKDIQSEPFTAVGIGDMSGDVFGNGMLLSEHIRLVAAFDHRHVFIDPDPDSASSWKERKRLFETPGSSWDDYDRDLLSEGGMIVPRGSKQVELNDPVRKALGISPEVEELDGESLIRAVLRAPAELLWNGGIGTYVKASRESDADVGDPSNDAVRVDGDALRCAVVGEGGNLGFTQEARIEYALAGGRLNTDAVDNSGGVDLSDREVNLKILLSPAVQDGRLSMDDRNQLLQELTEEVAQKVEADNRSQSLAVSLDELRIREGIDPFRDLMSSLERDGLLDRSEEDLPSWEELSERLEAGDSLTRPELCVLLSYAKLHLTDRILADDLPEDPATESYLLDYFPERAREAAGDDLVRAHRLRRELIASRMANDLVDVMGASFVHRIVRDTGRTPADVARAWVVSAELAGHRAILAELEERSAELATSVSYRWRLGLARVLARSTRWILDYVDGGRTAREVVEDYRDGIERLRKEFPQFVRGDDRTVFNDRVAELQRLGASPDFAEGLITLRFLDQLLEILRIAREGDATPEVAGRTFYEISEVLDVPWLRTAILASARKDRWEQRAAQSILGDLIRAQRSLARRILLDPGVADGNGSPVEQALEGSTRLHRFDGLMDEIRGEEDLTLAGLSVLVREVEALADEVGGA